jgi:hypothetical protein
MTTRTIAFAKTGHHYIFRYGPGMEEIVIDQIMSLAENHECDLDWLDAATLSFQIAWKAAAGYHDPVKPATKPLNQTDSQ